MRSITRLKKSLLNPYSLLKINKLVEKNAKKNSKKLTAPERKFKQLLEEIGAKYEMQKIVGTKIYDFYLPDINTLVEVDGDYYHGNPDVFTEQNKMQKRNIRNDKFKDVLAGGMGFELVRVWESELNNEYALIRKKIKKLLS